MAFYPASLAYTGLTKVTLPENKIVPFLELKRLLYELKDLGPNVSFRYRLMGEMWQTNFLTILQVTEKGAVFVDETTKKIVMIPDVSSVMQFELDHSFRQYEAHNHYNVEPALVY